MIDYLTDRTFLVGLVFTALVVYFTVSVIHENVQIRRLGGRAPQVRGKLPLGMYAVVARVLVENVLL